jgi:hypothetical protein
MKQILLRLFKLMRTGTAEFLSHNLLNIAAIIVLLSLYKCEPDYPAEITRIEKKLVVDGWIENDKTPIVILTYNTAYFSNLDSATFRNLVATRAKVVVYDDHDSEILTLTKDTNYFPPYVYKGYQLKGQPGKTYRLYIEDEVDTVYAETTIPAPVPFDSLWFDATTDTSGIIRCTITDNPVEENYYRFFTIIKHKTSRYIPTILPGFDDKYFNGKQFSFYLNRGPENYLKPVKNIEFCKNDTIKVKITTIDRASYEFWSSYDEEVINGANPFAGNFQTIKSNIVNGAGIWCGYGATTYLLIAR